MKNCKQCGKEFTPHPQRGVEQVYCSPACRTKHGNEKFKKMIEKYESQQRQDVQAVPSTPRHAESVRPMEGQNFRNSMGRGDFSDSYLSLLKELSEAKSKAQITEYINQDLTRKLSEANAEIDKLKDELDEEDYEEESSIGGMVGNISQAIPGLVTSFKTDPEATINFIGATIQSIFNPKQQKVSS